MGRRVLTSDDAVDAKEQHVRPCSDCPWARTSMPGWLGPLTGFEWMAVALGDGAIDCHVLRGAECAGAAIFRANLCKLPREACVLTLPADRGAVFGNRDEFLAHHAKVLSKEK
jgi:hypothetical protein